MANVYTSLSNTIWYTDKCSISTGNTAVTYQVYATALGDATAEGNIYSGPPELGAYERKQIYVGVGNYITVTGSNYTAQEIGGQTSAQAGTGNFTENLTTPEQRLVEITASYNGVAFIPGITDYSDAAGTIPAQIGDQVALVRCAAGSGKIAQFPSSHRPVKRQSGNGSYYYDPNGVSCYGVTDCSGTGIANIYMCGAGAATGNGKVYVGCFKAPNNRMYMGVSDGLTAGDIGAGVDGVSWNTLYADAAWSSATVVSVQRTSSLATLRINNAVADSEAISGVGSELPAYLMALNNDGTAIDFWTGRWYGLVGILDIVSAEDSSAIESDFANIAQVAEEPEPVVTTGSMFIPGTSSRVTLSPGIVVGATNTTPFTVEGWFYSTVTPGTNSGPVLLSTNTASSNPTYAKALTINIGSTTQIVVDSNGAAQQAFNFAETMLINTWYYVAVTRDSSGYIQVWLGKDGDANATASTTGRVRLNNTNWDLTGLSNTIGAFVPAGRYTTGYISNLRVDSTSLYATTAATITVPTAPFTELAGTVFLQNTDELTDETGTQTLTAVGTAAGNALNPF